MTAYYFIGHGIGWGTNSSKEGGRESRLARALEAGLKKHRRPLEIVSKPEEPDLPAECSMVIFTGVKGFKLARAARKLGIPYLYFDKPYFRYPRVFNKTNVDKSRYFWRVAINCHQPIEHLAAESRTPERWDKLNESADLTYHKGWKHNGPDAPILFAGSSEKYHIFHGLPHPTTYAEEKIAELRAVTDRPILYRPKPSWRGATPIPGTTYAGGKFIAPYLGSAHALVTHGSSACFNALMAGIPSIVLGDGIARPISSRSVKEVESPRRASEPERRQLLANLAWWQFALDEMRTGWMFDVLRDKLPGCVF